MPLDRAGKTLILKKSAGAQKLMESGYKLRRTDRGWHQWEMACITDRKVELFSKRNELIDTLSEERESTPEEERRIAQQERDSKTTKLYHGKAEIENWRQPSIPLLATGY